MNAADYENILRDFSSKFIATIGSEGSLRGYFIPDAMKLFDEDWPRKKHDQYIKELGCGDAMGLLKKIDKSKIRLCSDGQSRWHVAVLKSEANKAELEHIDSAILRKKYGIPPGRSGNIIPPLKYGQSVLALEKCRKKRINYDELTAIATASGTNLVGQQCPSLPPLRGANAMPLNNFRGGRNHNGVNASANSFLQSSSGFSVSSGMPSTQYRRIRFNRSRHGNITKTFYVDHDQPRNGHASTNEFRSQLTNKFDWSGNESQKDPRTAATVRPRFNYDPKERVYFMAGTRMYLNQLDSIKAEKSNEDMKKEKATLSSSSGSGRMTLLVDTSAKIVINNHEEEKKNAINESLSAPIDDDAF